MSVPNRVSFLLASVALAVSMAVIAIPASGSVRSTRLLPAFAGCGAPAVRPNSIVLACADGGQSLFQLHWSQWAADEAHATGKWWQNLCTPDCAAGHGVVAQVDVRLYRPRICYDGKLEFTRLTLRPVGKKPAVDAKVSVITVTSPFLFASGTRCP